MAPLGAVMTLMSLSQAPRMFLTVLPAFSRPCRTASSIPFDDDALSSITLVTDMLANRDTPHAFVKPRIAGALAPEWRASRCHGAFRHPRSGKPPSAAYRPDTAPEPS